MSPNAASSFTRSTPSFGNIFFPARLAARRASSKSSVDAQSGESRNTWHNPGESHHG